MEFSSDLFIFFTVVSARFLLPLLILRFPFPGILICLVLDAIDQSIFQQFTGLSLDGYQGYDKALDIYYLTIAYISTFRNWENQMAFFGSRFLYYYRMIGVVLYEFFYNGYLLLLFPNTFEYFFIYIEMVRLMWNPTRLSKKHVIVAIAAIWIFIKLPQEYWIHIANMDATDFIKEQILGVPKDTPPLEALWENVWFVFAIITLLVLIVVFAKWLLKRLPDADWGLTFDVDKRLKKLDTSKKIAQAKWFLTSALFEKIVMISLLSIIFSTVLPGVKATGIEIAFGVLVIISINTILSHLLVQRGFQWKHTIMQFLVMAVVNFGLVVIYAGLLIDYGGEINTGNTLFFALLLTLLVTLYDKYRAVYDLRFSK